ncbi:MAG: SDR family NAD(P)-dependent oxidoreductase [Saprospiraceae bacterium]|nr:SDR family NAD(P)-dependent oxidoreductase [Saprospiraceae bacterium]
MVTGATAGIGRQAAYDFAREGAFVIGIGRNPQRCAEAQRKIKESFPDAHVVFLVADLASQKQVHKLADELDQLLNENRFKALDILVNNAGVYIGKKTFTEDGIETTFAVNHLAPFLLTHLLIPRLSKSPDGRVITVSSDSHYHTQLNPEKARNPLFYFGLTAYKVSKLCNILFSLRLNQLTNWQSPHAFAVDPGLVNTDIGMKETGTLASLVWRNRKNLGVPAEVPSRTILYLANDPGVLQSHEVYWHDCQSKQPARKALDSKLAERLWIESCKLTGVNSPYGG